MFGSCGACKHHGLRGLGVSRGGVFRGVPAGVRAPGSRSVGVPWCDAAFGRDRAGSGRPGVARGVPSRPPWSPLVTGSRGRGLPGGQGEPGLGDEAAAARVLNTALPAATTAENMAAQTSKPTGSHCGTRPARAKHKAAPALSLSPAQFVEIMFAPRRLWTSHASVHHRTLLVVDQLGVSTALSQHHYF
jgi:hypothetical protein